MTRQQYTIDRKESGTGSIHDIASSNYDRTIVFARGCKYAVVLASYYGGKGYTTHRTESAACAKSRALSRHDWSHEIIDTDGNPLRVSARGNTLESRYTL